MAYFSLSIEGAKANAALEKRKVRKVADFDLPERSLVVIELDEHSLAHQPLIWRLLNSSMPAGFQCPSSLAAQGKIN